jgi:hypothetical protein
MGLAADRQLRLAEIFGTEPLVEATSRIRSEDANDRSAEATTDGERGPASHEPPPDADMQKGFEQIDGRVDVATVAGTKMTILFQGTRALESQSWSRLFGEQRSL